MNSSSLFRNERTSWPWATLLGVSVAVVSASAAETSTNTPPASAPAPLTPEQWFEGGTNAYNNWVDFSAGGIFAGGNQSQFQYRHQSPTGPFGGIEDLHYGGDLAKGTTLTVDGHSIFGDRDYALSLGVVKEKTGYLRLSVSQFREWYNGDGGFFPGTGTY
ncbi:MAG TPA: hypothetical protein VNZ22_17825, partial [Bacillota bacterium]|nr:hypothetical protein [Bacillota bacterium]